MALEGWDFIWSFYWACQTVTTVGYGDIPPDTQNGRLFCIFYIIFGVGYLASAVGGVVKYPILRRSRHIEAKVLNQFAGDLSEAMLNKIFHSEIYVNATLTSGHRMTICPRVNLSCFCWKG